MIAISANLKTSTQTTKSGIPSAASMASELIKSKPLLFRDDSQTQLALTVMMLTYHQRCEEFLHPKDSQVFSMAENIARVHARLIGN